MTDVSRRQLVKAAPLVAVAGLFGTARLLAGRHRQDLPAFRTGEVLTAAQLNAITERLNELSRGAQ